MTKTSLLVLVVASFAGLVAFGVPAVMKADNDSNSLTFDVACDCRTGATPDGGERAAPFMIQGKIFPAGTLASGAATNDPTQLVHGIASIGDWICRGQVRGTYPPVVAPFYNSTPAGLNTQYFILNNGGGINAEGYDVLPT